MRRLLPLLVALPLLQACQFLAGRPAERLPNEVIVLGTEHGAHLTNELYDLERLEQLVRAVDPQVVLCEIPPDLYEPAWNGFIRTGEVTEPHVALFPEFTEVLFPIALEGRLRLVPCSAWTREMAELRRTQLEQWSNTRLEDSRKVEEARERMERQLEQEGLDTDPLAMHSARFDAIVAEGLEPYERLFGRDLGPGGWRQINEAHHALIAEALDRITGDGKRVLVVFGALHKGRLRALLATREDIVLKRLGEVLPQDFE